MEIAFDTISLRKLCESESEAQRKLGVEIAKNLKRRLADLRAATSVKDLVAGRPRELDGARYRLDLSEGCLIIFCANHTTVPELKSGKVDWTRVSRVKLLEIERDHG